MKDSFWQWEEIIIDGICSTIFLYWLIGWPVFAITALCGLLWRLGGWAYGNKLFRRLGVPLVVCGSAAIRGVGWVILLAVPFMVWLAPSYGKDSWLYKRIKNDFLTRLICFAWYWSMFGIALILQQSIMQF